ncbi:hypothetical protein [Geothrix sp.]|jgi:hypothetical protein|uniref:hypothetical protein n=1 Tax=Geothrix sp. TaxID=1962974 RepID=UPI0025C4D5DF|nr:hypothetical protein [Geothrix sp.]
MNKNIGFKKIIIMIIILLNGNLLTAQKSETNNYFQGTVVEFNKISIQVDALSMQFISLKHKGLTVEVNNLTDHFIEFSPQNIIIIGSDGSQSIIETVEVREPGRWGIPQGVKVGPSAHIQFTYVLNSAVRFPVKLYYNGRVIAELTSK